MLEKIGNVAYRLDLPEGSLIHNVFHISQLKPFTIDYSPVYDAFLVTTDLEAAAAIPQEVVDRRLVKKGNTAIPQVKVTWSGLPSSTMTWEDYHVLKQRFPDTPAWGQAATQGGEVSRLELLTNEEGDSRKSIAFRLSILCHFTFLSCLFCQVDQCGQRL